MDMYYIPIAWTPRGVYAYWSITYSRGPLHVARSTEMGNAKASGRGTSNSIGTTLFVLYSNHPLVSEWKDTIMKTLNKNVCQFNVIVRTPDWECNVAGIPKPDEKQKTAAASEEYESYHGANDDYVVNVFSNYNEIKVEVLDSEGNEVNDFDITDIKYHK